MTYTLLGSPVSPFVRKVMVFFREKGVEFEHQDLNPYAPPEGFQELSPLGRIPVLRHDGRVVNDSSVICHYLERLHPDPALYPDDPYACARAEWLEEYSDGGLSPIAGPGVFRPLVLRPALTGEPPDEEAARKVIDEQLPPCFDYLDAQLGDDDFFVGNELTIADVAVATCFVNLRLAGVVPEAGRWPSLHRFLVHMHARDSLREAIEPITGLSPRWVEFD